MAQILGNLLAVRLAFLRDRATPEQRRSVLAAVPAETSDLLGRGIEPAGWYPFRHLVVLNRAIVDVIGPNQEEALLTIGRYAAEIALADVRDALLAEGSPAFLFRQAATIWHQHYDSGRVRVAERGSTSGVFAVEDFDEPAPEHCGAVRGWIAATIEQTGVRDVKVVERRCRCRGDERCEFECSWSAA